MEIITKNPKETQKVAFKFGSTLKGGEIIAFSGDLGAGKTTFIQGLGDYFGIKRIISPTFIIMRGYQIENCKLKIKNFFHIDLYRLDNNLDQEIKNLGITDFWGKSENIVALEWADKIKELLPKNTIYINIKNINENERQIKIIH